MIVVVITMANVSRKEEKILCLVPMTVRQARVIMMEVVSLKTVRTRQIAQMTVSLPPVMKMAYVRGKTVRMKLIALTTVIRHPNVIIMEYAILENIGLHVETVHHAPWRSQTMTMLPMPIVF
jgi:hypothetical protein